MPLADPTFKVHIYRVHLGAGHCHSQIQSPPPECPNAITPSEHSHLLYFNGTSLCIISKKKPPMKLIHPGLEVPQADLEDVMLPVKCVFLTNPVWS